MRLAPLLFLVACASSPESATHQPAPSPAPEAGADTSPAADAGRARARPDAPAGAFASNAGGFWAVVEPAPSAMPLNEDFALSVRLFEDESCTRPLEDVELVVDARMPAHGHGMNHEVRPERQADGSWRVGGMLLHMFGHWELYVDVTRGARTERAQLDVDVE